MFSIILKYTGYKKRIQRIQKSAQHAHTARSSLPLPLPLHPALSLVFQCLSLFLVVVAVVDLLAQNEHRVHTHLDLIRQIHHLEIFRTILVSLLIFCVRVSVLFFCQSTTVVATFFLGALKWESSLLNT